MTDILLFTIMTDILLFIIWQTYCLLYDSYIIVYHMTDILLFIIWQTYHCLSYDRHIIVYCSGNCQEGAPRCNCDAGLPDQGISDGGFLTYKEHLPVLELRFGDTGSLNDPKRGWHTLGELVCSGDRELNLFYDKALVMLFLKAKYLNLSCLCWFCYHFHQHTAFLLRLYQFVWKWSNKSIKFSSCRLEFIEVNDSFAFQ